MSPITRFIWIKQPFPFYEREVPSIEEAIRIAYGWRARYSIFAAPVGRTVGYHVVEIEGGTKRVCEQIARMLLALHAQAAGYHSTPGGHVYDPTAVSYEIGDATQRAAWAMSSDLAGEIYGDAAA